MAVLDKPSHAGGDHGSYPGSWPSAAQHGQGLTQLEQYHAKRQCKRAHFDAPAQERLLLSSSVGSPLGADFRLVQQQQQKSWSPSPLSGSPFGSRAASAPAEFAPATPPEQQITYAPTISPQVPLRWGNVAAGLSEAAGPQRDRQSPLSRPAQPVSLLSVALEKSVAVKAEVDGQDWHSSRALSTTPEARSPALTRTSDGAVEAIESPRDSAGLQLPCYGSPAGAPLPEAAMAVLMPSSWRRLKGSWKQPAPHDDAPAASSPLRLPAFNLASSRIWQAGQPRGLPPLPLKRQHTPRTISMVAAANVSSMLSRGHCTPDDDGDLADPYQNPSSASSLFPHPNAASPTQPSDPISTSSNSWRPQASPFAAAAQDQDAGGAAIPSSGTAAGGTSWHGSWADEEDDEDLDDYYVNKLCGGRDPLAAFIEEERRRSGSLSAQLAPQEQEEEEQQQEQEQEHAFPLADGEMLVGLRSQELHPSGSLSGELEQEAAIARQLAASIAAAVAAAGQRWAGEEVKEEEGQQRHLEKEQGEVEGGDGDVVVEVLVHVGPQGKGQEPKACDVAGRMEEGSEGEGAGFGGLGRQQSDTEMGEVAVDGPAAKAAAVVCAEACDEGAACGCHGGRDCAVQPGVCCHAASTSYFKCYYHRVAMEAAAVEGPTGLVAEQRGEQLAGHGVAMGMERAGSCLHCRVAADVRDLVGGVVWEAMFGSSYGSSISRSNE